MSDCNELDLERQEELRTDLFCSLATQFCHPIVLKSIKGDEYFIYEPIKGGKK